MISLHKTISLRAFVTGALIFACICFGGSASVVAYEMGLSIFALVSLLVVVWFSATRKIEGSIKWFIAAFVLLLAFQLIPLPYVVSNMVPQRQFAESLLPNTQLHGMWLSVSIAPDETLYSLIAVAPALIGMWLATGLSQSERLFVANILVLAVFIEALIGIAQAAGAVSFSLYDYHHPKVAIGLFASRNHFADLILMGTSLAFVVRQGWSRIFGHAAAETMFHVFLLVFLFAMIGSASRAGLVIFLFLASIGYLFSLQKNHRIAFTAIASVLAAVLWAGLEFFPQTGIVKTTLARFEMRDEGRFEVWNNSQLVVEEYGTFGSGFGSFRSAFERYEPIRSVSSFYVNSAHNEYIQLIIEAGLLGSIIAVIIAIIASILGWNNRHSSIAVFGSIGIVAITLHALVDYPFRSVSVNVVFSYLFSIVITKSDCSRSWLKSIHPAGAALPG